MEPDAEAELDALPATEYAAMQHAFEKLAAFGDRLQFPHSSQVKGAKRLRELRPRAGRGPWRAFYRRIGGRLIVAAIGPEAQVNPTGFRRATRLAESRLANRERTHDAETS